MAGNLLRWCSVVARTVARKEVLDIRRSYLLLYLLSKVGIIDHDKLSRLVYIVSSELKEDLPFEYEFQHEDGILFSQDLNEDLTKLARMGFIEMHVKVLDDVFNIRTHEYKLTKYGEEVARRTGEELGERQKDFDHLIEKCKRKLSEGNLFTR